MLKIYDMLDAVLVKRQGEVWWECDAEGCDDEVEVTRRDGALDCGVCGEPIGTENTFCGQCGTRAPRYSVPDGWRTSHHEDDPVQGAAQMCPLHSERIVIPPTDGGIVISEGEPPPDPLAAE